MEKFDSEVGVSFSSRKRTSRSCLCLIILSVAVILLVTVSAIFVTLYVTEKRTTAAKTNSENVSLSTVSAPNTEPKTMTPPSTAKPSATTYFPTTQKIGEQKYCGSKNCLLTSLGKLIFPSGPYPMLNLFWQFTFVITSDDLASRVSFNLPTKIDYFLGRST